MRLATTRSSTRSLTPAIPVLLRGASLAAPLRRPLFEESGQAFAKIPAHVAHDDEVLPLARRDSRLQAVKRLLGGAQRQRRMPRDGAGERLGARGERRRIGQHLADEAERLRLRRVDKARREDEVLDARRTDERREARIITHRETIAEGARDRKADAQTGCGDAQVAGGGD